MSFSINRKSALFIGVALGLTCSAFVEYSTAAGAPKDSEKLEGRSLLDVIRERTNTKNVSRAKEIDEFVRLKAAPRTIEDMKFVETELAQNEERRARALVWLSNTNDAGLKSELVRFFKEKSDGFPPEKMKELKNHGKNHAQLNTDQEILGNIMLKLSDLGAREIIPRLREYANSEEADKAYISGYAREALARMKDEGFFGRDRREQLAKRYVNFDDPKTKPWLKETIYSDPDMKLREFAADAWSKQAANSADPLDVSFAHKLIDNPGANVTRDERAYLRARGFDVLIASVGKGHFDREIFEKAVAEARGKDSEGSLNGLQAAQLLGAFGKKPEFKEQALDALNQLLIGPNAEARGAASRAIGRLTGTAPHYEGEVIWKR